MKNPGIVRAASNDMMDLSGSKFINTPNGHIETDIAAAIPAGCYPSEKVPDIPGNKSRCPCTSRQWMRR